MRVLKSLLSRATRFLRGSESLGGGRAWTNERVCDMYDLSVATRLGCNRYVTGMEESMR